MKMCHVKVECGFVVFQYRASAFHKMKIEPAMIFHSWKIPQHPRWLTKMITLLQKKSANHSLFSKCSRKMTSGQNAGTVTHKKFYGQTHSSSG